MADRDPLMTFGSCTCLTARVFGGWRGLMVLSKFKVGVMKQVVPLIPQKTPITYIGERMLLETVKFLKMHNLGNLLIVTDGVLYKLGLLDELCDELLKSNINYHVYDQVKPDPTFDIVEDIVQTMDLNKCDSVMSFGGGSVIDCVKLASVAFTNHFKIADQNGFLKLKNRGLPFIAVPTTCGTGSETTIVAVISDSVSHKKSSIISRKMIPDLTILDPFVTSKLPNSLAIYTALDALTHALEAYVSGYASDESNFYALSAIKLIFENLPYIAKNESTTDVRTALLTASFYAGIAFTRAFVGYVHAFAHQIGGMYGVPHGQANAVLLPHIMNFYLPSCDKKFSEIYRYIYAETDIKTSNNNEGIQFIKCLYKLLEDCNVEQTLNKFPKEGIDKVIKDGFKECHGFYAIPQYMKYKDAEKILQKVAV